MTLKWENSESRNFRFNVSLYNYHVGLNLQSHLDLSVPVTLSLLLAKGKLHRSIY